MLKKITIIVCSLLCFCVSAQSQQAEMADTMRSEGKIYVVIAVLSIVFLLLAAFLVVIERRVKRLEDEMKKSGDK